MQVVAVNCHRFCGARADQTSTHAGAALLRRLFVDQLPTASRGKKNATFTHRQAGSVGVAWVQVVSVNFQPLRGAERTPLLHACRQAALVVVLVAGCSASRAAGRSRLPRTQALRCIVARHVMQACWQASAASWRISSQPLHGCTAHDGARHRAHTAQAVSRHTGEKSWTSC